MPTNKVHDIMDDSLSYPYSDTAHVTRAGLMLNTLDKARSIVITDSDMAKLMVLHSEAESLNMDTFRDIGPMYVQFDGQRDEKSRFIIGVLTVPMVEVDQFHCYPYSNNNHALKMWPYDKHFLISNVKKITDLNIQSRSTHPLAVGEQLDENGSNHMSALGAIIVKLLIAVQQGSVELVTDPTDFTKLNRKRAASKKFAIKPDTVLEWK